MLTIVAAAMTTAAIIIAISAANLFAFSITVFRRQLIHDAFD